MALSKDTEKRIVNLMLKVMDINNRRYSTFRLSFKVFQDRIELVKYFNEHSPGTFWDASFNSLEPEQFEEELTHLESIIAEIDKKWRPSARI